MQAKLRTLQTIFPPRAAYPNVAWLGCANLFLLLTSYFLLCPWLYRSGDALFGLGFSGLFAYSLTAAQLIGVGLAISVAWSLSGYHLGKNFNVFKKSII
jgi:hypothetical protein